MGVAYRNYCLNRLLAIWVGKGYYEYARITVSHNKFINPAFMI